MKRPKNKIDEIIRARNLEEGREKAQARVTELEAQGFYIEATSVVPEYEGVSFIGYAWIIMYYELVQVHSK